MFKKIFSFAAASFAFTIYLYLVGSFIAGSFNILLWGSFSRFVFGVFWTISLGIAATSIILTGKENETN